MADINNEEAVEVPVRTSTSFKQVEDTEPHWYVVHTYSGYENKVKADIEKTIENRKLQGQMLEVMVPLQDVVETKSNGEKKTVSKKLFPGYVLVHMIKNDVTWYVVRNTRGVTGFVGPGSEPVPLTEAEMRKLGVKTPDEVFDIDVEVGDAIKVISGAWEGTEGNIKSINAGKQTVTIDVDIFGRTTSVEISLGDIEKF
ncbi:MAG: transcription termination/antitermination factor NusG [Eubacterium sp.]|nr:transcription termination/antitermination factor NusG [Eubacterium sp.]MBR1674561.1 transcription termination/antitermination factor NusG [Eubacterium sp.]